MKVAVVTGGSRGIGRACAAEPKGSETLRVAAEIPGRLEEGDARSEVDRAKRRLKWSGEGEARLRGWLKVSRRVRTLR